jgi:hypothetical protein
MEINPQEFCNFAKSNEKMEIISDIIDNELDYDLDASEWLEEVLRLEAEKAEPFNELLNLLISSVGKDVHREKTRNLLGGLFKSAKPDTGIYTAVKAELISCVNDELNDVKNWALNHLKSKEEIADVSRSTVESYLINNLQDQTKPPLIRARAALALGELGTVHATMALLQTSADLLSHDNIINEILQEKIQYSLELVSEATKEEVDLIFKLSKIVPKLAKQLIECPNTKVHSDVPHTKPLIVWYRIPRVRAVVRGEAGAPISDNESSNTFSQSSDKEFGLSFPTNPQGQFVLIAIHPDGHKSVLYPHTYWNTEMGKTKITIHEDSIDFVFLNKYLEVGEHIFVGYVMNIEEEIQPIERGLDQIEWHDKRAQEFIDLASKLDNDKCFKRVSTCRIVD